MGIYSIYTRRRSRLFENALKSKSLDNKNAKYAKKSRLYIASWIEIATLGEDTDPDTDVHGGGSYVNICTIHMYTSMRPYRVYI